MKIVPLLVLTIFIASIISVSLLPDVNGMINVPPTPSFNKATTSNGTVHAMNYSSWLHFQGLGPISITSNNLTKTIFFNATVGNGTTLTALTCSANYQLHSLTISGGLGTLHCAPNNSTGSSTTLDVIHNLTPAQAYVFQKNTTNIDFQFRGFNVTGSNCNISNSSTLVSLYCKTWQNNTGTNLGIWGSGVYNGMSGSLLQFLKLLSTNNLLAISTNSSNVLMTIQHVITDTFKDNSITCSVGNFFNSFSNTTGIHGCGSAITSINSQSGPAVNIVCQTGNTTCTNSTNQITIGFGPNPLDTGGQPQTINKNVTVGSGNNLIITASSKYAGLILGIINSPSDTTPGQIYLHSGTNQIRYRDQTGTSQHLVSEALVQTLSGAKTFSGGLTMSGSDINLGSNALTNLGHRVIISSTNSGQVCLTNQTSVCGIDTNTAQGNNLTSTNGGGFGVFEGRNNATQLNFRTLTSINTKYLNYDRNTTSLGLNVTIPTTNVVDVYDKTIGDYTQPSTAFVSSVVDNLQTTIPATQLFTYDKFNETSGNIIDQCNNVAGTLCAGDTGTQTTTGATLGVPGKITNAINFTGTTNRLDTGSTSESFMHNQTATFSVNVWLKFQKNIATNCNNAGLNTCAIFCDANNIAATGVCLQMKITSSSLMCPEVIIYNGGNVAVTSGGCIKSTTYDQNWHMYTFLFKYTNSTNQQCVGVDGGAFTCAAKNATAASNGAQQGHAMIGNRVAVDSSCLCAMDELSVWRTYILKRSDVITLYNSGSGNMINVLSSSHPGSNAVDGNTATFWESLSEIHPWVYVDTGTTQMLSASAVYWNSTSTCTQLLLQTSSDSSTWNTKRTTNTNLLTNVNWNYERWDLDNSTERYVRFYCNDGTAKQLSVYELKVLIPTSTQLLLRHGHDFIDPNNATLSISR